MDQSNSLPGAAKRYERQRGAEAAPRSWGRRSGDELRASSLRPSGEEERVVWSRQFPASWGPLGIRVSGSAESSTSPLDKCVRVARVSAQLRSVCSLQPRGLPGSRREGALCQGPRSSLRPPRAAGGSRLYVLVLTKKMDVYENLGVFALPHEL